MRKYYVNVADIAIKIVEITRKQRENRVFENIEIRPYNGTKYGKNTVVIMEG